MPKSEQNKTEKARSILCVDDEVSILRALTRLLRYAGYRVLIADTGEKGLKILASEKSVSAIISDQRMPTMQGNEFLRQSRKIAPNAIRILLTAHADINAAIAAINTGAIYKFILKPWDNRRLLEILQEGIKQKEMEAENKRLTVRIARQYKRFKNESDLLKKELGHHRKKVKALEEEKGQLRKRRKEYGHFVDTLVAILEGRNLRLAAHSKRVAEWARRVAQQVCNGTATDIESVEMAAKLHDIGKFSIPYELIFDTALEDMSEEELDLFQSHTILGQQLLRRLTGLSDVRDAVRSHHENFDGSGYPDGLRGEQIPLASRIIAVANGYDNLCHSNLYGEMLPKSEAIDRIVEGSGTLYDPKVLAAFITVQRESPGDEETKDTAIRIELPELKIGMVLARDLYTIQNTFLLPKDTVINQNYIETLMRYDEAMNSPVDLWVHAPTEAIGQ